MKRATLVLAALAFSWVGQGRAGMIVDQKQLSAIDPIAYFGAGGLGQSFEPSLSNITGAAVDLYGGSGNTDITISLYSGPPTSGTLLASGTDYAASPGSWATLSFGSDIPVTPNTTYFLSFASSNSSYGIAGAFDPYPRGESYIGGSPDSRFDFAFETFADANVAVLSPEPASLTLVAFGGVSLLGYAGLRRRRKVATA